MAAVSWRCCRREGPHGQSIGQGYFSHFTWDPSDTGQKIKVQSKQWPQINYYVKSGKLSKCKVSGGKNSKTPVNSTFPDSQKKKQYLSRKETLIDENLPPCSKVVNSELLKTEHKTGKLQQEDIVRMEGGCKFFSYLTIYSTRYEFFLQLYPRKFFFLVYSYNNILRMERKNRTVKTMTVNEWNCFYTRRVACAAELAAAGSPSSMPWTWAGQKRGCQRAGWERGRYSAQRRRW